MSSPSEGAERRVAIVVGLPLSVRSRLEQAFTGRLVVRIVLMKRDGGYFLEPPPRIARQLVERFSDDAAAYENVVLVLLPYVQIPPEVTEVADLLASLGTRVIRPSPNVPPWPARPRVMDNKFQTGLLEALRGTLEDFLPADEIESDAQIIEDIIRGLVTHSKMGPNNHSHEDDLWKSRGKDLGPGDKDRILNGLLGDGILSRKQNTSAGGKGWVYWIADVPKARARCPALDPYFSS